jgi:hypothetical protein
VISPWAWAAAAIRDAIVLALFGVAAGVVGVFTSQVVGMLLGGVVVCIGGAIWAVPRIGTAGLGAALIGLVASIGVTIEGHRARIAQTAEVVELDSLSAWDPDEGVIALHTRPVQHLRDLESWVTWRSGSGKNATTSTEVVTPLFDATEQRVVGFHCRPDYGPRQDDGGWMLSTSAWSGTETTCTRGVAEALQRCSAAGLPVDPGAAGRLVEVFASEDDLRGAANLHALWAVPTGFLVLYSALVILFRARGAASV